ncbi:hypothetical protein C8J57DRAFT_595654 [Mycena rebaudengoi]|nr:hypothetical protein C8J57DRAFT_595654 [Mycena rebaudengoi]
MFPYIITTALFAASSVAALSLSKDCQNAFTQVAANSEANACLSVSSLITVVLQPNNSIITPVDNWLKAMCGASPCSNDTLAAVATNITTGCSADLGSADSASTVTSLVQQYYPVARQVLCLSETWKVSLAPFSLSNAANLAATLATGGSKAIPSNVTCTNCSKGVYNILNKNFPNEVSSQSAPLQSQCGSSFTDGTTPDGIVSTASTGAPGSATGIKMMTQGAIAALVVSVVRRFVHVGAFRIES